MPDEKEPSALKLIPPTIFTGILTTPTRNMLNLAPNYTNMTSLVKETVKQGFKGIELNVPRTTTAVFSQMLTIRAAKQQLGEEARLEAITASAMSGASVAKLFETPLIKIAQAKKISPTAHFKGLTIVSDAMPTLSWSMKSPFLFFLYFTREFCFTATVLTNDTHLFLPKNYAEFSQFSYDLIKQIALYSTGSFLSASVHKIIVPTASREIFNFVNQGTTPHIEADGILSTFKKLGNNVYTHPGFKGPHNHPTYFIQKLNNGFYILCGPTMFITRTFYLLSTKAIIDCNLSLAKKINLFFSNKKTIKKEEVLEPQRNLPSIGLK